MAPVRVLVVEDRPMARMLLEKELASAGDLELVGAAKNGREAVERVRSDPPDVVVMDLEMPEMDGIRATHEIRKFSNVPIIILTGTQMDRDTIRGLAERRGADLVLFKPSGTVSADVYKVTDELVAAIRRFSAGRELDLEFED